ncbi:MAG: hypothetical protein ACRD4A_13890, partial [Candidatus Acidiferrales bacterium]
SSGAVDCNPACQGTSRLGDSCIDTVTNESDTLDATATARKHTPEARAKFDVVRVLQKAAAGIL